MSYYPYNKNLNPRAKQLRRDMTPQEKKLWYGCLRNLPQKVYKQRIIGSYIVDFYCAAGRLAIELDGQQHLSEDGKGYDSLRTEFLDSLGIEVLRFQNEQIDHEFLYVCDTIKRKIAARISDQRKNMEPQSFPQSEKDAEG